MRIIELKPEDINILNINIKCPECGYIHNNVAKYIVKDR